MWNWTSGTHVLSSAPQLLRTSILIPLMSIPESRGNIWWPRAPHWYVPPPISAQTLSLKWGRRSLVPASRIGHNLHDVQDMGWDCQSHITELGVIGRLDRTMKQCEMMEIYYATLRRNPPFRRSFGCEQMLYWIRDLPESFDPREKRRPCVVSFAHLS
jgi:hypothetical protein